MHGTVDYGLARRAVLQRFRAGRLSRSLRLAGLIATVAERGLDGTVVFAGYREDAPRVAGAFDVFVLPSIHEGLPIALLEGMVWGTPAVVTRVGGNAEVVDDGVTTTGIAHLSQGRWSWKSADIPPVDLNTATLEVLDTLPGVGPVTGQAILDWRAEHGVFSSVDELLEVDPDKVASAALAEHGSTAPDAVKQLREVLEETRAWADENGMPHGRGILARTAVVLEGITDEVPTATPPDDERSAEQVESAPE
ncbi:MAG: glycosyltransferase [Actinobacteria bacterium]|nr:glycosyltransferase [Actinomycetota bacterium]